MVFSWVLIGHVKEHVFFKLYYNFAQDTCVNSTLMAMKYKGEGEVSVSS